MNKLIAVIDRRKALLFASALLLLNFLLKYMHLGGNDIANDEPFSIFHAQMPLRDIIILLQSGNNPPLYEILLHFWIKISGIGPESVRFPSLVFSVLTALVIFRTAHRHFNFSSAVLASLLFTFATPHTYYAHEARGYTLFILLAALSVMFLLDYISHNKTRTLVWLGLTDVLLIYTHYFGFFVLLVQWLALPLFSKRIQNRKAVWGLAAVVVLSFVPMVPSFAMQLYYSVTRGTWVSPPLPGQYYGFLNIFLNNRINTLLTAGMLAVASVLFFTAHKNLKQVLKTDSSRKLIFVFLCFFVPYTLMFLLSFKAPMFIERYVIFTSVFFYILMASLLGITVHKPWIKGLFMGVILAGMVLTYNPGPPNNRDIKNAVAYVSTRKSANTLVLVCPDYFYPTFCYHYNPAFFKDYKNTLLLLQRDNVYPVLTQADVARVLLQHRPYNLVYFHAALAYVDPGNDIYKLLWQHYNLLEKRNFLEIFSVSVFQSKNTTELAE